MLTMWLVHQLTNFFVSFKNICISSFFTSEYTGFKRQTTSSRGISKKSKLTKGDQSMDNEKRDIWGLSKYIQCIYHHVLYIAKEELLKYV